MAAYASNAIMKLRKVIEIVNPRSGVPTPKLSAEECAEVMAGEKHLCPHCQNILPLDKMNFTPVRGDDDSDYSIPAYWWVSPCPVCNHLIRRVKNGPNSRDVYVAVS